MQTILIVNPQANRGQAGRLLPQIFNTLNQLTIPFVIQQTTAPNQAGSLAYQAVKDGYERVVAVGGDGTCNEVVNGLLRAAQAGHEAILGIIPLGSGNDLAFALKIPFDLTAACRRLTEGGETSIDVGLVTVDGQSRYFANNLGLGLDAEVVVDTANKRLFSGFAMYLWSVFKIIARGQWPYPMAFSLDEQTWQQSLTLITVANGIRAGGGFLLTPNAKLDDALFDICFAGALSKLRLLDLLPKTFNGSHVHHPAVTMAQARQVKILVPDGVAAHIDGEVLCHAGQEFEVTILPHALQVWR